MISEERLRLAAQRAGKALAEGLPEPEDCHHTFSPAFERKIKRLIRKHRYQGFYKGMRRVACVLLVLLLSSGSFLSVSAEARGIVFGWVSERLGTDQRYSFSNHSGQEAADIRYYLPEVPEGYEFLETVDVDNGWTTLYSNEDDEYLDFSYFREPPENMAMSLYLTVDGMDKTILTVHGMTAEYYEDSTGEHSNALVWIDTETNTLFYLDAYLEQDQLVKLAESVTAEEN